MRVKNGIALLFLTFLSGCTTVPKHRSEAKRRAAAEASDGQYTSKKMTCELRLIKLDAHNETTYDFKVGEAEISLLNKDKASIDGRSKGLPFRADIASNGKGFGYRLMQDKHVIIAQPISELGAGYGLSFTLYREIDRNTFKKQGINNVYFHCYEDNPDHV